MIELFIKPIYVGLAAAARTEGLVRVIGLLPSKLNWPLVTAIDQTRLVVSVYPNNCRIYFTSVPMVTTSWTMLTLLGYHIDLCSLYIPAVSRSAQV